LLKADLIFVAVFFTLVGLVIAGAVGLFAIYSNILDEDIADFRVCFLPGRVATAAPATATTSPIQT
jgi:hypothetical protein